MIYQSQEHLGKWYVKATIEAVDVDTGELSGFTSTWLGVNPTRETIASVIGDIITHEVREQLGLDPHDVKCADKTETRMAERECWMCGHRGYSALEAVRRRPSISPIRGRFVAGNHAEPSKYRCVDLKACEERVRSKLIAAGVVPPEKKEG
jgi:hypothetical protein